MNHMSSYVQNTLDTDCAISWSSWLIRHSIVITLLNTYLRK